MYIMDCSNWRHSIVKLSWTIPLCWFYRGVYLAAVFYHKDSVLVTTEDQIPIVEVDDSYSSSLMQDFLWFTKVLWVL
jgi:hypothetical protein